MHIGFRSARSIALLAAATLVGSACGAGDDPTNAVPVAPVGAGAVSSTVVSSTDSTTVTTGPDDCAQDRHAFKVAIEAHIAREGRPPDAERELVDNGLLRTESGSYDLVDGELVRIVGAPCDYEPMRTAKPLTTDRVFGSWPDALVEQYGGPDCALEQAAVMAAGQNFINREYREPETLADLEGDLDRSIVLWEWSGDSLVAVAGSGCTDPAAVDTALACRTEYRTLAVAREAYLAQTRDGIEPTGDDLVTAGYLLAAPELLVISDDVITAVPGGDCEGIELEPEPAQPDDCDSDRRALEVAAQAYSAQRGEWPGEEVDLVTSGMLRTESTGYDLGADGRVVAAPGGGCE